ALCGRGARIQYGEDNLLERARTREKIEILKDETQLAVSDISQGIAVEVRYRVPAQKITARARRIQAADNVHQRRFTGARGAHDGDKLPLVDFQRDVQQGRHGDVAHAINFGDVLDLNDGGHRACKSCLKQTASPVQGHVGD